MCECSAKIDEIAADVKYLRETLEEGLEFVNANKSMLSMFMPKF